MEPTTSDNINTNNSASQTPLGQPKKPFNTKLVLIVAGAAALVATGIWAAIYPGWTGPGFIPPPDTPSPAQTTTPTPPQNQAADETINWQTYRDDGAGFEIRYPLGFEYLELEGQINFRDKGTTRTALSYFTFISLDSAEKLLSEDPDIESRETRGFGDVKDGIFYTKRRFAGGLMQTGYIFEHSGKIYSFWNQDYTTKDLFLQMLSTFRFTPLEN